MSSPKIVFQLVILDNLIGIQIDATVYLFIIQGQLQLILQDNEATKTLMSKNSVQKIKIKIISFPVIFSDHEHKTSRRLTPKSSPSARQNTGEFTNDYWIDQAQAFLKAKLGVKRSSETRPKNIILFIADGMSLQTSAVARVHAGGNENHNLAFDTFPFMGLSKTYCVDRQVPDSAATATAFLTGVKTNYGLVGVDSNVRRYNCEDHANVNYRTRSIADWAMDAGKASGLVTTVRVTHASPSPIYAHSANRYWESDSDMAGDCDPNIYDDIAEQLVFGETGKKLKVVLGGGRNRLLPSNVVDEEGTKGVRADGKNLINDWLNVHKDMGNSQYVWNRDQMRTIDTSKTDYLLGLFSDEYVKYDYQAKEDPLEPSLSDMTEMAIKMLQKEQKGYFLFVEGGRVDTAHHDAYAKAAVDETRAFSEAIDLAVRMTNSQDTLIVVSADHAHTMTYNGYPTRGNDVFGVAELSNMDHLPYSTLSYANGPGMSNMYTDVYGDRADISKQDLGAFDFRYYGHFPTDAATHAGDDVGIYATGPQSQLFEGAYEQNAIPFLIAYAAEIGPYSAAAAVPVSLALSSMALFGHFLRNIFF